MAAIADCTEMTLGIYDGQRIAVKCWGDEKAKIKVLATHGWLDNASTWDFLAPLLVSSKHSVGKHVSGSSLFGGIDSHRGNGFFGSR